MSIFWAINIINEYKYYLQYNERFPALKAQFSNSVFVTVIWIFLSLGFVIHPDIRENGICNCYSFYNWQRIKEWKRIDDNTIQLRISLFSKLSYRVKLQVSKYSIWSMIEILENHAQKEKKIIFKENRAD